MINKLKNKKLLVLFDQILVSGSNFLLGILLARNLGMNIFGEFSFIWLIVLFFSSIQLALIISPILTHATKKSNYIQDFYLTNFIYFQLFFSFLCLLILISIYKVSDYIDFGINLKNINIFVLTTILAFLSQDFIRRYYIIKNKYFTLLSLDIVAYLGQLLVILILIFNTKLSLENLFITISLSFFTSYIIGLILTKRKKIKLNYARKIFKRNWSFSQWLVYSSLLQWGTGNLFIIMAGTLLGPWAVGVIRIMQNTMGLFNVLFIFLENVLPINFANIFKKYGFIKMYEYYKLKLIQSILIMIALISIIFFISDEIVSLLYGNEYLQYSYLLIGYFVIYMFLYLNILQRILIRTVEKTKIILFSYVISSIFSIFFSTYFISKYGINGVIYGTIITQILILIIIYFEINKLYKDSTC